LFLGEQNIRYLKKISDLRLTKNIDVMVYKIKKRTRLYVRLFSYLKC
jgi:hypothetical protein